MSEEGAAWFRNRKWFTRKRIKSRKPYSPSTRYKNKYALMFQMFLRMAKNSGGEKYPFFQEAHLEIPICIRFRSVRLSELLAKQILSLKWSKRNEELYPKKTICVIVFSI